MITEDPRAWMEANRNTTIIWKEEDVYNVYKSSNEDDGWNDLQDADTTEQWCRVMMAGILGTDKAKEKYPELYI